MAAQQPDDAVEVLRAVWAVEGQGSGDLGAEHRPHKHCKNMKHVSFDGMAAAGSDLRAAWRDRLAREGKLVDSAGTVRDLVFGSQNRPDDVEGRPARD